MNNVGTFKIGDMVLRRVPKGDKLDAEWTGPHEITEIIKSRDAYRLGQSEGERWDPIVSAHRLLLYSPCERPMQGLSDLTTDQIVSGNLFGNDNMETLEFDPESIPIRTRNPARILSDNDFDKEKEGPARSPAPKEHIQETQEDATSEDTLSEDDNDHPPDTIESEDYRPFEHRHILPENPLPCHLPFYVPMAISQPESIGHCSLDKRNKLKTLIERIKNKQGRLALYLPEKNDREGKLTHWRWWVSGPDIRVSSEKSRAGGNTIVLAQLYKDVTQATAARTRKSNLYQHQYTLPCDVDHYGLTWCFVEPVPFTITQLSEEPTAPVTGTFATRLQASFKSNKEVMKWEVEKTLAECILDQRELEHLDQLIAARVHPDYPNLSEQAKLSLQEQLDVLLGDQLVPWAMKERPPKTPQGSQELNHNSRRSTRLATHRHNSGSESDTPGQPKAAVIRLAEQGNPQTRATLPFRFSETLADIMTNSGLGRDQLAKGEDSTETTLHQQQVSWKMGWWHGPREKLVSDGEQLIAWDTQATIGITNRTASFRPGSVHVYNNLTLITATGKTQMANAAIGEVELAVDVTRLTPGDSVPSKGHYLIVRCNMLLLPNAPMDLLPVASMMIEPASWAEELPEPAGGHHLDILALHTQYVKGQQVLPVIITRTDNITQEVQELDWSLTPISWPNEVRDPSTHYLFKGKIMAPNDGCYADSPMDMTKRAVGQLQAQIIEERGRREKLEKETIRLRGQVDTFLLLLPIYLHRLDGAARIADQVVDMTHERSTDSHEGSP
jgi:hypothetical protein